MQMLTSYKGKTVSFTTGLPKPGEPGYVGSGANGDTRAIPPWAEFEPYDNRPTPGLYGRPLRTIHGLIYFEVTDSKDKP